MCECVWGCVCVLGKDHVITVYIGYIGFFLYRLETQIRKHI